ncbi:TetR family transcriptional regulator [Prauserella shujinwangii]|uniref:TetR family transcriptional regulator n=1 Tax=Prauserella shujinwangii TaxID=1453103 RepID=A0A2T0LM54_9PSEU|nr:TetR/AcrR family transcriptional regulator [Prauserella shujinwangii]PRX44161.1 TetR family transcriptional regulator [Prauserella shujinwangii]
MHRDGMPPADHEEAERPLRADARRNRIRILEAAGAVFAEQGASASTEAVAERAGVAIGTVFRHFPTKPALLQAVVMNLLDQLITEVDALVEDSAPGTGLFELCTRVMEISAQNGAVFERLAETGTRVHVGDALARVRPAVELLLDRARNAGAVRGDLRPDELTALLAALCQEAMTGEWSQGFRRRALTILFDGMRPGARPRDGDGQQGWRTANNE